MKMKQLKTTGFTLVEIMIVVAIVGLLAAISLPNFARARQASQTTACINNLRQIDAAIQEYALENNVSPGVAVLGDDVAPYLPRGVNTVAGDIEDLVFCPADNNRAFSSSYAGGLATVNDRPTCVIGAGFTPPHVLP